jgi:hypothetical protein
MMEKFKKFEKDLRGVLNTHSQENTSDTPDWILSQYLCDCLDALNAAIQKREAWHGRDPRPSAPVGKETP